MATKPSTTDPFAGRRTMMRPAVLRRFVLAGRRRITLISGSPGCGKSSAIAQRLAGTLGDVAVLRVRPEHRGVAPLARAFARALEPIVPSALRYLPSAYTSARRHGNVPELLALWFAEVVTEPMTIVVDDLHRIDDDETFHFLARLVDATPADVRWMIGLRSTAPLPVPRWLAGGMAATIGDDALRLDAADVAALAGFLDVDAATVDAARIRHDGNIGAVVAECGRTDPERSVAAIPDRLLFALAALPDLEPAAVADVLVQEPFADAVAWDAFSPGHERVRSEAFARSASCAPDVVEAGRIVAARALERTGRIADALQSYVAARARGDVARVLREHGFELYADGSADIVCGAIDALTDEERRSCAIALTVEAIDESFRGRYDVSEAWFEQALRLASDERARLHVDVAFAVELLRRGRADALERLESLARVATDGAHAVTLLASLATAHANAGRLELAQTYHRRALEALADVDDDNVHATVHQRAAFVALACGNVAEAQSHATNAATRARALGKYEVLAVAESVTCVVAYSYRDDHQRALDALGEIAKAGKRLNNAFFRRFALIHSYLIFAERCDAAALRQLDTELAHEELESSLEHVDEALLPARALVQCWSGDFATAYEMLAATGGRQPKPEMRALRWAELSVYAAVAGRDEPARAALRAAILEIAASAHDRSLDGLRASLLAAIAASLLDERARAAEIVTATEPFLERWPRWLPFHALVAALADGRLVGVTTLERLEEMHDEGLGGWARLIENVPLHRLPLPIVAA